MSIKKFREDVQEIIDNVLVRLDDGSLDPNAACTRMFRCWIDGSYDGVEVYKANKRDLWRIVSDGYMPSDFSKMDRAGRRNLSLRMARRLRSWVGHQFTAYVAREVGCSYGTAQRYIVSGTSAENLVELTGELIDDALDLIDDHIYREQRDEIIDAYNERYAADPVVVGVQAVQA